jgi:predicted ATPase
MAAALAQHDAQARTAVAASHGVIVKSTGDGLLAAFSDPLDALHATVAFQQALADPALTLGIALRVRCGLHLGVVERRDNDLFGNPVNRTARIMSIAHGGQILVSQAVADEVAARLPAPATLRDLGSVRLKGLAAPERVYQILHPALRQDFPALQSLEATPNNLPQQLTSFVGRERELAEATDLLGRTRLLTLLGMGGIGKTRLSLQIAGDLLGAYADGAWFIDLAPIRDGSLVPSVTAQILGLQEEPGRSLTQTLCAYLQPRSALLILDNCEHLTQACATFANALLRAATGVRIIATSREALRVPGEQTYPVLPMAVPDRTGDVALLARSEAVQLFMDRARLQKPGFALTPRDAPAVAELCARLEGIPLAMELAAARMRSLSVQDINRRLSDRYKLLTGGDRVLLERQQTLRALVAWSYDLLPDAEQLFFNRLGVFVGGFELAAAEAVCGTDPLVADDVLDLLTSLVDKSLVMVDEADCGTRYRMLETLRDYAREGLARRDEAGSIAIRHCDHFLLLAKAANQSSQGSEQAEWTRRLEGEHDNLRAAIALALDGATNPVVAVKFEVALMWFRVLRGYVSEGRKYVRRALALPAVQESAVAHAHAQYVGAVLADNQSDYAEARQMLEACLALRRGLGKRFDIAATLSTLATVRLHEGDAASAQACEEEALGIFRALGDRVGEAIGLFHLGQISMHGSDDAVAHDYFEQCLVIACAIDHRELEGESELVMGELALDRGDLGAADARFARSLAVCRDIENKRGEAMALWWTGRAKLSAGDSGAARTGLREALRALQAFEMHSEVLCCLDDHADLLRSQGAVDDAVRLFAAVDTLRQRRGLAQAPRREAKRQAAIVAARHALGEPAFATAWSSGQRWELDQAIRCALTEAAAQPF